ncbi:MAG: virulence factor family protein [Nevskia sp.]|nr:virulence factor family protein [Nevskia sp.]
MATKRMMTTRQLLVLAATASFTLAPMATPADPAPQTAANPASAPVATPAPATSTPAHKPAKKKIVKAKNLAPLPKNAERFDHGRFEGLTAYRPNGTPARVVLFMSGDEGWNLRAQDFAQALVAKGALVVGIDTHKLLAMLEADGADCEYLDGDLENLSHFVQAYYRLPGYRPPFVAGYAEGATLAYMMLVQAPDGTFAGALSLAFSPALALKKPLCVGSGVDSKPSADGLGVVYQPAARLGGPWVLLQGEIDRVVPLIDNQKFSGQVQGAELVKAPRVGHSFSVPADWTAPLQTAYDKLIAAEKPQAVVAAPADLDGLPVLEVPVPKDAPKGAAFALLMSGDGGWAGLDQAVAGALAAQGIPVVGLDSLRYYWSPRTPDGVAKDVDKIIRYYLGKYDKQRVLLVGYSQGADVLPFALNRLPAATRAKVGVGVVMGLSEHALFEFHMSSWVSNSSSGFATMPEVSRISGTPLLCIYGEGEDDSLCPKLDPKKVKVVKLPGGHHFDGNYERLAQEILSAAK